VAGDLEDRGASRSADPPDPAGGGVGLPVTQRFGGEHGAADGRGTLTGLMSSTLSGTRSP
jgi:hypothetical protein